MKHPIKWIYFYTEDYGFWHKHLVNALDEVFDLRPISVSLIKAESKMGDHHFRGVSIKIELLIKSIEENMGDSIIFSDCTLWINEKNKNKLQVYMGDLREKYDIVFADNVIDRSVNIGLMLINCNKATLNFFREILAKFKESSWDQQLINDDLLGVGFLRITRFGLVHKLRYIYQWLKKCFNPLAMTWSFFDAGIIVCGTGFRERYRASYCVYKQFINPSDPISNWNQRLSKLYEFGFLEFSEFEKNIRK